MTADSDVETIIESPANRKRMLTLVRKERARMLREAKEAEERRLNALRHEYAEKAKAELDAVRERCSTLAGFVREAWPVLEPETTYQHNWHIDAICAHLEAVTDGRINRLLINVPPGSSKSLIVSVLWPAWEWAKGRRGLRYLTTSFAEDNAKRDSRKHRDLVMSEWYKALFPEVVLTRTGEMSFANSATGNRECSAFGSLTSKRGDRLIIDDPHSTSQGESDAERAASVRKFREGAVNRLNDQERSAIVVVMQRLHGADISGTIIEVGMGYTHLCIPMEFETVDEKGQPFKRPPTKIGWTDPRTRDGELMDPQRFPRAVVAQLKIDMGSYGWAGQYQQRPTPREGGLFKRVYFEGRILDPAEVPPGCVWLRHWDLAATELKATNTRGARTAGVRLGRAPDGRWIVGHCVVAAKEGADRDRLILATAAEDGMAVEVSIPRDPGAAGKTQVRALASKLSGYVVRILRETGDKVARATPIANQAEAGNLFLVAGTWNTEFLDEVCLFPGHARKDIVDGLSGAFAQLVGRPLPSTSHVPGVEVITQAKDGDYNDDDPDDEAARMGVWS